MTLNAAIFDMGSEMKGMQALIGMGLAIAKTAASGHIDYGTALGNAQKLETAPAVWNIFTAFGSMAFAYSYVRAAAPKERPVICRKQI